MAWRGSWTGTAVIMINNMPNPATLRNRIVRRVLGVASAGVLRGMATLAFGSGIARVIGVVTMPALTRLYGPADFAALAVFTALVATLAPLVTLRYALALPLPRSNGVAMNLLVLSMSLMLAISALIALALWLGSEALLGIVSMEEMAPWWWLIALGVLGTACYETLTLWATRQRAYKVIAQTSMTQSAAGAVVKIALGLLSLQPWGLLLGQVVAQAGGIGRLLRSFLPDFRTNWQYISAARIRKAAWQHRSFPIWRVPSQFIMALSMQAPVFFMAAIYDPQTAGQFALAVMALSVPTAMLGQSAGKALYGEASRLIRSDPARVAQMAREVQFRLALVAVPASLLVFLIGESMFTLVFGDEWRIAGSFASVLAFALLFQFTSAPLIQLFNLMRNQLVFLLINISRVLGSCIVFYVVNFFSLEAISAVTLYTVFTTIFYLCVSFYILHTVDALRRKQPCPNKLI